MALADTTRRVAEHTPEHVNEGIKAATLRSIKYYRAYPDEIPERLKALDKEWDIERVLVTNAASLMLLGTGLGIVVSRRFLVLPAMVSGFLLQHALQGWCPPLSLFRRLGVRTAPEIENERYNLLDIQRQHGE